MALIFTQLVVLVLVSVQCGIVICQWLSVVLSDFITAKYDCILTNFFSYTDRMFQNIQLQILILRYMKKYIHRRNKKTCYIGSCSLCGENWTPLLAGMMMPRVLLFLDEKPGSVDAILVLSSLSSNCKQPITLIFLRKLIFSLIYLLEEGVTVTFDAKDTKTAKHP